MSAVSPRIAYVISPHGFGHASRSAAVLEALRELRPEIVPHLFTTVPPWFLEDSLGGEYELHPVVTDVGLVQLSPIEEDPPATLEALNALRPFSRTAEPLARAFEEHGCELVVCDISPLGLAAAKLAGRPSVLVESFTWDWIYEPYFEAAPGLEEVAREMTALFATATLHLQTEPACQPARGAISVAPVYREPRSTPAEVRKELGLDRRPLVLISMGGISSSFSFLDRLRDLPGLQFVAFGGTELERRDNLLLLPHRSPVYFPDLVATAEAVVGKLGYSTVAEAWGAGTRYAYVPRPRFPEGPFLAEFVGRHLPGLELDAADFESGDWLGLLPELLDRPRPGRRSQNGARQAAEQLSSLLDASSSR
jgi:hypothetical protein